MKDSSPPVEVVWLDGRPWVGVRPGLAFRNRHVSHSAKGNQWSPTGRSGDLLDTGVENY
jgi:hypothetical protein